MNFKTQEIIEDDSSLIEPGWEGSNETKFLTIDWNKEEDGDINLRSRSILTYRHDWLQGKRKENMTESSPKVISSPGSLQSDTSLSNIVGDALIPDKKVKSPPCSQAKTPRMRSQSKSEALKQSGPQKKKMTSQE